MARSRADSDREFLARAAEIADLGRHRVEPNPVVGCVLVKRGRVVAEGHHAYWGGPHAEAAALRAAGDEARGAIAYVTLEPCGHRGKTGPCADALVRAGVKEVVYAAADPNPATAGTGPKRMREAGIAVRKARPTSALRRQLAPYLDALNRKRPWVIAKWAMTLDGRIATRSGDSRWISSERSRKFAHKHFRARVDAILCGAGTVRADDPSLTNRSGRGGQPLRVIVCGRRKLPRKAKVLDGSAPTLIAVPEAHQVSKRVETIVAGKAGRVDPRRLLRELHRRGVRRVLVEGGGELHGSMFDRGLVDQVLVFVAPRLIGGIGATAPVGGRGVGLMERARTLEDVAEHDIDGDRVIEGRVVTSPR